MLDLQAGCSVTRSVKVEALIKYVHTASIGSNKHILNLMFGWLALMSIGWCWLVSADRAWFQWPELEVWAGWKFIKVG